MTMYQDRDAIIRLCCALRQVFAGIPRAANVSCEFVPVDFRRNLTALSGEMRIQESMQTQGISRHAAGLVLACIFQFAGALGHADKAFGQFEGERRRGDLAPIELPGGAVVEFKAMVSQTLGGEEPYSIFLPPSFRKDQSRTYPVVYFLHGLNNDQTSWTVERYGNLQNRVEELILDKKIPEIIMVHPFGNNSFYCNYADGTKRYEDFVTRELVAHMESNYRARKGRENRAIGGTSMGGYGALKIAMKHPGLYAATVGHSPIIFLGRNPLDVPDEVKSSRYFQYFASILKLIFGDPIQQDLWDANNPLTLARSGKLNGLKIYFDCGTADRYNQTIHLDQGVQALDRSLTEAGVSHSFYVYPGEPHGWALVSLHIGDSLPFLCRSFVP
jgi:S-formylglutathione hydrolase FrmB